MNSWARFGAFWTGNPAPSLAFNWSSNRILKVDINSRSPCFSSEYLTSCSCIFEEPISHTKCTKIRPRIHIQAGRETIQRYNDTLRDLPDAYPQTLAAAFRIAQGWTESCPHGLYGPEVRCWRTKSEDSIAE